MVRPQVDKSGLVQIVYRGPRKGGFEIVGGVTRTRYGIPGQGQFVIQTPSGTQGVNPADVNWFKAVAQGRDFQVVPPPQAAPKVAAPKPKPTETPRPKTEAWQPSVMEPVELPKSALEAVELPDLQALTVAEIKEMAIGPGLVDLLLVQEREGKGRVTVLDYLEKLAE